MIRSFALEQIVQRDVFAVLRTQHYHVIQGCRILDASERIQQGVYVSRVGDDQASIAIRLKNLNCIFRGLSKGNLPMAEYLLLRRAINIAMRIDDYDQRTFPSRLHRYGS